METMRISRNSWQTSILRLLKQPAFERVAIIGIGNTFRSDDAAGSLVARALAEFPFVRELNTILVVDAGPAPENVTGHLRQFDPDLVLLIDAADMGGPPGMIRLIEMGEIEGLSASTHSLPLSILAKFLVLELHCQIALLGIQPGSTDFGESVTEIVQDAADQIVTALSITLSTRSVTA